MRRREPAILMGVGKLFLSREYEVPESGVDRASKSRGNRRMVEARDGRCQSQRWEAPVASAPVLRSVDLGRLLNIDEPREAKPPGHL